MASFKCWASFNQSFLQMHVDLILYHSSMYVSLLRMFDLKKFVITLQVEILTSLWWWLQDFSNHLVIHF